MDKIQLLKMPLVATSPMNSSPSQIWNPVWMDIFHSEPFIWISFRTLDTDIFQNPGYGYISEPWIGIYFRTLDMDVFQNTGYGDVSEPWIRIYFRTLDMDIFQNPGYGCLSEPWQLEQDQCSHSTLFLKVNGYLSCPRSIRLEDTLSLLHIGHSCITNSFLPKREKPRVSNTSTTTKILHGFDLSKGLHRRGFTRCVFRWANGLAYLPTAVCWSVA